MGLVDEGTALGFGDGDLEQFDLKDLITALMP
jgi:hypothetical protein